MSEPAPVRETPSIEHLFRQHGQVVRAVLLRLVGPCAELEDLEQTTFFEALRSLSRFRGDAKPSTWICGIAAHVAHHHLRAKRVRRHVSLDEFSSDKVQAQREGLDLDRTLDEERARPRLTELLGRIQPKKRDAFVAYVLHERSVPEIAHDMDASQAATRSRIFFARRELQGLIARDPALRDHASRLVRRRPSRKAA
jgi:RNA polymerase sigma-70 factor (ECF subfamily)